MNDLIVTLGGIVIISVVLSNVYSLDTVANLSQIASLMGLLAVYQQFRELNDIRNDPLDLTISDVGRVILTNRSQEPVMIKTVHQVRRYINIDNDGPDLHLSVTWEELENDLSLANLEVSSYPKSYDPRVMAAMKNDARFKSFAIRSLGEIKNSACRERNNFEDLEQIAPELISGLVIPSQGSISVPDTKTLGVTAEENITVFVVLWVEYALKGSRKSQIRVFTSYMSNIIEPGLCWICFEDKYQQFSG